jgi:ABC-type Mn2+/Zn2+ transport system permease subunit
VSWWDSAVHRAAIEAVLAGVLCGLIGVQVVLRRLAFTTLAMAHATFPGVVLAAILGVNIAVGGILAGVVVAIGVTALSRARGQSASSATGIILAGGFALGAGLVATQNGFSRDLSAFLVGAILTVSTGDIVTTSIAVAVVGIVLLVAGRQLTFVGFDPTGARAVGFPTGAIDLALLLAIEVVIVAVVPAVGTILALALIVAPAAAARLWSARIAVITLLAVVFAMSAGLVGLAVSARFAVAAGAAITLTATAILLGSLALTGVRTAVAGRRSVPVAADLRHRHPAHPDPGGNVVTDGVRSR